MTDKKPGKTPKYRAAKPERTGDHGAPDQLSESRDTRSISVTDSRPLTTVMKAADPRPADTKPPPGAGPKKKESR